MSQKKSLCLSLFQKAKNDEDNREAYAISKSPQKQYVQYFRALLLMTEQEDMIIDIEVDVHHAILIITKITPHKTNIALHLEIASLMTKVPLHHTILAPNKINLKENLHLIVLLVENRIDLQIDMTLIIEKDLVLILEITTFQDILLHSDQLQSKRF